MTETLSPSSNLRFIALLSMGSGTFLAAKTMPAIDKAHRLELQGAGLVRAGKKGNAYTVTVTEVGRERALEFIAQPLTSATAPADVALLGRWVSRLADQLGRVGVGLEDLLAIPISKPVGRVEDLEGDVSPRKPGKRLRAASSEAAISKAALLQRIEEAYGTVKATSGIARLAALRRELGDVDRTALDTCLVFLHEERKRYTLMREDDQRSLNDADRAAAINYKGEPKHLVMRLA